MTDEQRRIRGYLQAQGAKLSPAEVIEREGGRRRTAEAWCAILDRDREALFARVRLCPRAGAGTLLPIGLSRLRARCRVQPV